MRRKTSAERDLATHETKLAEARAKLDQRRSAESEAKSTHDEKLRDLRHDLGLGRIDEAAYERERAKVEEPVYRAEYESQRAEGVVEELGRRTADLSQAVKTAEVAAAEGTLARDEAAVAEAEETFARRRRKKDESEEALALARRALVDARAGYGDPDADAAAQTRAESDRRQARWLVRHGPPGTEREPEKPWLDPLIEEERKRLDVEREEVRRHAREHPDRLRPEEAYGEGALHPGEPFATVEAVAPPRR